MNRTIIMTMLALVTLTGLAQSRKGTVWKDIQKPSATYKLIGRNGNILDVNAAPCDLSRLAKLIESMKE